MDMIRMDFIGPIRPSCEVTGHVYILVVIDYFSRFLWARGMLKADQLSTMKALLDHVFPIVGWPLTVYTDSGTHFTGAMITKMWKDHGVIYFSSVISYPQSVGLSEHYVQILIGRIQLSCIASGFSRDWSLRIRDAVLSINTRCIKHQQKNSILHPECIHNLSMQQVYIVVTPKGTYRHSPTSSAPC